MIYTERTIACAVCGFPYPTNRKNAKLCRVCQLCRDTEFVYGSEKKCLICDKKFAPLTAGAKPFCGSCSQAKSRLNTTGRCSFCQTDEVPLLHDQVPICMPCSTNPKKRDVFIKELHKKQARQIKEEYPEIKYEDIPDEEVPDL